jgi:cytochrome c5
VSRRALVLGLALVALVALKGVAAPPHARPLVAHVLPGHLPAAPERAIAERACLLCHSPQLIAQQHKDAAAWEKTNVQMEKGGAPLTPAEHDSLKTYLTRRFGPRASPKR